MSVVRYEIRGVAHCRTPAMVHFKQFLELMEGSRIEGDYVVGIEFAPNDGSKDAEWRDSYGCPDSIIPLFVSTDLDTGTGFHMLHGVSKHGAPWDSEGLGQEL